MRVFQAGGFSGGGDAVFVGVSEVILPDVGLRGV